MVALNFKAIPVVPVICHLCQGSVSFGADGNIFIGFVVDDKITKNVFFVGTTFQETLPVIHDNVNGMDAAGVKETALISGGSGCGLYPQPLSIHKDNGDDQGEDDGNAAAFIDKCMR